MTRRFSEWLRVLWTGVRALSDREVERRLYPHLSPARRRFP